MKNTLALMIIIGLFAASWNAKKCEHVYVAVEKSYIKISEPQWSYTDDLIAPTFKWPRGIHEGIEIVCIKCFHTRKQTLDYGPSPYQSLYQGDLICNCKKFKKPHFGFECSEGSAGSDSVILNFGHPFLCDSSFTKVAVDSIHKKIIEEKILKNRR